MKTEELIAAMAADRVAGASPRRALVFAIGIGTVAAAALFLLTLGPRPDVMHAVQTMRYDFKFVATMVLAASAAILASRLAQPGVKPRMWILFTAPALMLAAVVFELLASPVHEWMPSWIGHNALLCMTFIPLLSLPPLGIVLAALSRGAALNPARAGAVAGLVAGGIGAAFYAAHCFDDSPLFVATWYSVAIGVVTGLGALLGSRVLRW